MKTISFIFLVTVLFFGCSKNDETPTAAADQLPPATQTGANKVGCLVNGQVFLPRGSNPFGPPISTCSYQFIDGSYEFGLGFTNDKDGFKGITILSNKQMFVHGQTYLLKQ
jgi:hypothetical protein